MDILKINFTAADFEQLALTEFLSLVLQSASAQIIEHLTQYHSQNGDTCQINQFEVSNANLTGGAGSVVISYLIHYHYGCADITRQAKDHETWRFEIDADKGTLTLYMPEYEVRSTADEF